MFTQQSYGLAGPDATVSCPLITIPDDGEPFITSFLLAEGLGIAHRALIATIRKHLKHIERFGRVLFRKAPLKTKGGNQKVTYINLNQNQSLFVGSLSDNSEQVVEFKATLIDEFDKARRALIERNPLAPVQEAVLIEQIAGLEGKIERMREAQREYFEAKATTAMTNEQIETRIMREKIMAVMSAYCRRFPNFSWTKFWESFTFQYDIDVRSLDKKPGEHDLDVAIRHGHLTRVWEILNWQ